MTFDKTVEALITEFSSDPWHTHDALLEEIETSHGIAKSGQYAAIVKKCEDRGLDSVLPSTLSMYFKTACWVDRATSKQSTVIRSKEPTYALYAMQSGWLPEDLVTHINAGGKTRGIKPSQSIRTFDEVEEVEEAAKNFAKKIVAMIKAKKLPNGALMFMLMSLRVLLNEVYDEWAKAVEPDMDQKAPNYLPESWVS